MVCRYKYCKEKEELTEETAETILSFKYHKKCAKKINGKKAIRDLYCQKVSNTVVMALLNKVIQNMIDVKEISPEYLYFALRYAINHGIPIKSPNSLPYIIDNYEIKNAFKKFQTKNVKKEVVAPIEEKEITFNIEPERPTGWNFFGG